MVFWVSAKRAVNLDERKFVVRWGLGGSLRQLVVTRAQALRLHGLLVHWPEAATAAWVEPLLQWEEDERSPCV